MKTIGLIGGMSWESTVTYYQVINEMVRKKLGGLHSAKLLMYSVDFDEIEKCQSSGDWKRSADILADAARRLENAGTDSCPGSGIGGNKRKMTQDNAQVLEKEGYVHE